MSENSIIDAKQYYLHYDVDNRIKRDKAHLIEFLLSLFTLEKYINKHANVIDIGCGTGNYSVALSDKCNSILAVDMMDNLLDILRNKIEKMRISNITCLCSNVLEVPNIVNKKFDLILCMGPMYHLNNKKDRISCFTALKKLGHKDSIFIFTYLNNFACLSNVFKEKIKFNTFVNLLRKDKFYLKPFYFTSYDYMARETIHNGFEIIEHLALDPVANICTDSVNNISEENYNDFVETLKKTNKYPEFLRLSSHNMIVAKLKKD